MIETVDVMRAFDRVKQDKYAELLQLLQTERPLIWAAKESSPLIQYPGLFRGDVEPDQILKDSVWRAKLQPTDLGRAVANLIRNAMSPRFILSQLEPVDVDSLRSDRIRATNFDGRHAYDSFVRCMEKLLALGLIIVSFDHADDVYQIKRTKMGDQVLALAAPPRPSPSSGGPEEPPLPVSGG